MIGITALRTKDQGQQLRSGTEGRSHGGKTHFEGNHQTNGHLIPEWFDGFQAVGGRWLDASSKSDVGTLISVVHICD